MNTINYFVNGHTAKGFVQLIASNIQEIEHVYVLQHFPPQVKTFLIQKLIEQFKSEQIETLVSPDDPQDLDGIIIRKLSFAVLCQSVLPENFTMKNMQVIPFPDNNVKTTLATYEQQKVKIYEAAYALFKGGLSIHDQLEKIYGSAMNFQKADKVIENVRQMLFATVKKQNKKSHIYRRMFATNTPDGFINYMEDVMQNIGKRIFIYGRAGTGKSYLMNKIYEKCLEYGFDVEVYHCSLDPKSFDMLIVRELDVCLFDSTPPHELMPTKKQDIQIDMFKETVNQAVENQYEKEITQLSTAYKQKMKEGLEILSKAKKVKRQLEKEFEHQVDKTKVDPVIEKIKKLINLNCCNFSEFIVK